METVEMNPGTRKLLEEEFMRNHPGEEGLELYVEGAETMGRAMLKRLGFIRECLSIKEDDGRYYFDPEWLMDKFMNL